MLLLATERGVFVELVAPASACQPSIAGPAEEQEPPAKRTRVEGGGDAAPAAHVAAVTQPVVLILVGLQGSGKSTFCQGLQQRSQLRWSRINQDSIAGPGKRGTREQCLEAARHALQGGSSVAIDR